jgi:hypothetical protein
MQMRSREAVEFARKHAKRVALLDEVYLSNLVSAQSDGRVLDRSLINLSTTNDVPFPLFLLNNLKA